MGRPNAPRPSEPRRPQTFNVARTFDGGVFAVSTPVPSGLQPKIHLFEPSGYAGVFQHACRLGELLVDEGIEVVLHTGHEHEEIAPARLELCACSWWPRTMKRSAARSAGIAATFVARTLPHLRASVAGGEILHVQGIAAAGALTLAVLATGRMIGAKVVYSPHDTFSRRGPIDAVLLKSALQLPNAVIVHSKKDTEVVHRSRKVHYAPLIQLIPHHPEAERDAWRTKWDADEATDVVLFAGCIRPEKRLDLLLESTRYWPPNRKLAVVGEDRGGWDISARLAREKGVEIAATVEFVSLDRFAAALSAADVVVAPHAKASQSGVLSVARQLGVPTVAADVGGLAELASETFSAGDPKDLARAIESQLSKKTLSSASIDEALAIEAHLEAYYGAGET